MISADSPEVKYTIHWGGGRDRDVFSAEQIIAAMRNSEVESHGKNKIAEAMNRVVAMCDAWVIAHRKELMGAWITERDGQLLLVAVDAGNEYNSALHNSLIELDLKIANDKGTDPISFSSLFLPSVGDSGLSAFLSPTFRHNHPSFK